MKLDAPYPAPTKEPGSATRCKSEVSRANDYCGCPTESLRQRSDALDQLRRFLDLEVEADNRVKKITYADATTREYTYDGRNNKLRPFSGRS